MTDPELMSPHSTEEALAAFVDDGLSPTERDAVIHHLAVCSECRGLLLMVTEFRAQAEDEDSVSGLEVAGARSLAGRPSARQSSAVTVRRGWIAAGIGLAAAAAIAFVMLRPWGAGPDMGDVASAVKGARRPFVSRLSGPFEHALPERIMRSPRALSLAPADLYSVLAEARDPHVRAVAQLLAREDKTRAIATLEQLYENASSGKRDALAVDLSAALLARADDERHDNQRALTLAEDVIRRRPAPEAYWNRAVALGQLRQYEKAVAAWDDYLRVDTTSGWAAEAKTKREQVADLAKWSAPQPKQPPPANE